MFLLYFYPYSMGIITRPIIGIAANGFALYLLTLAVNEIAYTGGIKFFIIGGLILGIVNLIFKPILKVLSLPFVIITGGLFLIVINMAILWFLQYFIGIIQFQDVTLSFPNFPTYVIGAVVFGVINWIIHLID